MSMSAFFRKRDLMKVKEVLVSPDFEKFKIRSMSAGENNELKRIASYKDEYGVDQFDNTLYGKEVIKKCVVYPDLKDKELQDFYEVLGEFEVLETMLNPGEFAKLEHEIMNINGFNKSYDDKVGEAKN